MRLISFSRPITGSSSPRCANSVRSVVYWLSTSNLPSASFSLILRPPRMISRSSRIFEYLSPDSPRTSETRPARGSNSARNIAPTPINLSSSFLASSRAISKQDSVSLDSSICWMVSPLNLAWSPCAAYSFSRIELPRFLSSG